MKKHSYHGVISHRGTVLYDFEAENTLQAFAILSLLIEDDYPYAKGHLIDTKTGQVVYQCRRSSYC